MRVISTLFTGGLFAASGQTAHSLSSNGDTALIMLQTLVCVALLALAVYCKNRRRTEAD